MKVFTKCVYACFLVRMVIFWKYYQGEFLNQYFKTEYIPQITSLKGTYK